MKNPPNPNIRRPKPKPKTPKQYAEAYRLAGQLVEAAKGDTEMF